MAKFQDHFTEIFLEWTFTKIAKIIPLRWPKWPQELKLEKKDAFS